MTIVLCILNMSIAFAKEFFLYQTMKNKSRYAVKNNRFHQTVLFHKTIAVIFYFLITSPTAKTHASAIANATITIFTVGMLYFKLPFYNHVIFRSSILIMAICLSFSFISVLGVLGIANNLLYRAWIPLTPLFILLVNIRFNMLFDHLLRGNFKSPEEAVHFVCLLKRYKFGYIPALTFEQNFKIGTMLANGTLLQRRPDLSIFKESKTVKDFQERVYVDIVERLTPILEKHPNSDFFILYVASIYLKKLDNIPGAITLIQKLDSLSLSIAARNTLEVFNIKLRAKHAGANSGHTESMSLLEYFKQKELSVFVKEGIQKEAENQIEFWQELRKESVNMKLVIDIAYKVDSGFKNIQKSWQEHASSFMKHFVNTSLMYGIYLEVLKENPNEARRYIKDFLFSSHYRSRAQTSFDVYSDEISAVVLSIDKAQAGKILDASGSLQTMFKVKKSNVIGKNLNSVLPSLLVKALLKKIQDYAKMPTNQLDHTMRSYGRMENGDLFEIELCLQLFPVIDREVKLMILFKKLSHPKPIMIIDPKNFVLECAESIRKILKLNNLDQNPVKLGEILAPESKKLNTRTSLNHITNRGSTVHIGGTPRFPADSPGVRPQTMLLDNETSHKLESLVHISNTRRHAVNFNRLKPQESTHSVRGSGIMMEKSREFPIDFSNGNKIKFMALSQGPGRRPEVQYEVKYSSFILNGLLYRVIELTSDGEGEQPLSITLVNEDATITSSESEEDSESSSVTLNEHFTKNSSISPSIGSPSIASPSVGSPRVRWDIQKVGVKAEKSNFAKAERRQSRQSRQSRLSRQSRQSRPSKIQVPLSDAQKKEGSESHLGQLKIRWRSRDDKNRRGNSKNVSMVKRLRSLLNTRESNFLSRLATTAIFILIVMMIALIGSNYIISHKAIKQINLDITIINQASLRLTKALRGWQDATRLCLRLGGLSTGEIPSIRALMHDDGLQLLQKNKDLNEQLSSNIGGTLINKMYEKDIGIWLVAQNKPWEGGKANTFIATNYIGQKMTYVANSVLDITSTDIKPKIISIVNNTGNDYLVESQKIIIETQKVLESTVRTNISSLQVNLGLQSAVSVMFCLCLLLFARIITRRYQRFFKALMKIENKDIDERLQQIQRVKTLFNEDIETKKFSTECFRLLLKEKLEYKAKTMKETGFHKKDEKLIIKDFLLYLIKFMLLSLLPILLTGILFIGLYLEYVVTFESLDQVNNQLSVTTRAESQISIVLGTFYIDMVFSNQTDILVKHKPTRTQLQNTARSLFNVNSDLKSVFTGRKGIFDDELIKYIMDASVCEFLSSSVQDYCAKATGNKGAGLQTLNSNIATLIDYYTTVYLNQPTFDNAKKILKAYGDTVRPLVETLEGVYEFLNAHILGVIQTKAETFDRRGLIISIFIVIVISLSLVMIKWVIISRLQFLDTCRGSILRIIPASILFENKATRFYLNKYYVVETSD